MTTDPGDDPALAPPAGVVPNFDDPSSLIVPLSIGTGVVLGILTIVFVIRVFTKIHVAKQFHIEDYLSCVAWSGLIAYSIILIWIDGLGFARHQWDITQHMFSYFSYYINVVYIIYAPTTGAAKLSVLFQIKRLFSTGTRDAVQVVAIISIISNMIFYTGLLFAFIFQCWPREAIWNSSVPGHCVDGVSLDMAAGIINLVSDIEALLLPMWAIWHLSMPMRQKIYVIAVFGIGLVAVAVASAGVYYRVELIRNLDFSWVCAQAGMLVVTEIAVVIIVGCVPSLPRFVRYIVSGDSRTHPTRGNLDAEVTAKAASSKLQNKMGSLAKYLPKSMVQNRGEQELLYSFRSYSSTGDMHLRDSISTHLKQDSPI